MKLNKIIENMINKRDNKCHCHEDGYMTIKETLQFILPIAKNQDKLMKRMLNALIEIGSEKEIHTKLNQERLCCKFQDIAIKAIQKAKQWENEK